MNNRTRGMLALAALVSFAACGGGGEGGGATDDAPMQDTGTVAPVTPAPVVTDTAALPMDSVPTDTTVAPL